MLAIPTDWLDMTDEQQDAWTKAALVKLFEHVGGGVHQPPGTSADS